ISNWHRRRYWYPSIYGTVTNVITCSVQKSNIWIRFPTSCEDLHNAKNKWQGKFNFPSAIGAIDCTHLPILKPFIHADEYVNRKNFASINVQATCNSNEEFTKGSLLGPAFIVVAFSTGPALPDASSVIVSSSAQECNQRFFCGQQQHLKFKIYAINIY
ncbi:unnamed protein product, partial [Acanthoscelides obtectus]